MHRNVPNWNNNDENIIKILKIEMKPFHCYTGYLKLMSIYEVLSGKTSLCLMRSNSTCTEGEIFVNIDLKLT